MIREDAGKPKVAYLEYGGCRQRLAGGGTNSDLLGQSLVIPWWFVNT